MSMSLELLWWMLLLTNPSPVALSITAGVVGFTWPISVSNMCISAPLWKWTKRAPSYASIMLSRTLCRVVHSECTGTYSGVLFSGPCWDPLILC